MNDLGEMRKKIDDLKEKHQNQQVVRKEKQLSAMVVCSEIVGAVVLACVLGIFLDSFFKTKFLFIALLLVLAFASSLYTLYKIAKK